MNAKYLKTLEYNKMLDNLNNYCKTYLGKEEVVNITPEFSMEKVTSALEFTKESVSLIFRKGNIPLSDVPDISLSIKSLESNGILSISALLNISRFLKISREVKEYFFFSDDIDL